MGRGAVRRDLLERLQHLTYLDVEQRRFGAASDLLGFSLPLTIERDLPICRVWQLGSRGRLHLLAGDWDDALADADEVLAAPRAPLARTWPHLVRGLVALRRGEGAADAGGDAHDVAHDLDEAWRLAGRFREPIRLLPAAAAIVERVWLTGAPDDRLDECRALLSRDLAREVITKNKLAERPEFDPVLQGVSPLKSLLAMFGIGSDPFAMTPEERVLDAYYDRLTAYAVDKSRVIVIEFQSRDPELAARVANSIAESYLVFQQARGSSRRNRPGNGCRARSTACARRSPRPNPTSRISAPSRACSSAPTTPRCRTSRWARSIPN